jgi:hypothetical protein
MKNNQIENVTHFEKTKTKIDWISSLSKTKQTSFIFSKCALSKVLLEMNFFKNSKYSLEESE